MDKRVPNRYVKRPAPAIERSMRARLRREGNKALKSLNGEVVETVVEKSRLYKENGVWKVRPEEVW